MNTISQIAQKRREAMPSRSERAAARKLHHRDALDEQDVSLAQIRGVGCRLSTSDRAFLKDAYEHPLDVEELEENGRVDAYTLLYLLFYKLIDTWIDPHERVWVRTTRLGSVIGGSAP
jgi:hypothetical protein